MALGNVMPELINSYQIFGEINRRLLGVSGEVEMPDLEALTESLEVSGALGELEVPATGQFKSMKMKIPFAIMYEDVFAMADTTKSVGLTLRASEQYSDPKTYDTDYYEVKIVVRGKPTKLTLGKLVKGKKGEPALEIEIYYIKIVIDNVTQLELDKIGFKYVLHEVDMLKKIRKQVGL